MNRKRNLPMPPVSSKKSRKPLAEESLKVVLQHMEPNKRIELANQCPSIRKVDRCVPLHINYLYINRFQVKINETTYKIGAYRKYPNGVKVPKPHQEANEEVNCLKEFDKNSFGKSTDENAVIPGNIAFWTTEDFDSSFDELSEEDALGYLQNEIEESKEAIETDLLYTVMHPTIEGRIRSENSYKRTLCENLADLQPYLRKRKGLSPPFEPLVQMAIITSKGKKVELYRNDIKLYEAMNKLTKKLFGNRETPMIVKRFEVEGNMLRIPADFKVRVRQLIAPRLNKSKLDLISPILDPLSFPLDLLNFTPCEEVHYPMKDNAKELIFENCCQNVQYPDDLAKFSNPIIHLNYSLGEQIVQLVKDVVAHWMECGREIGSRFSMDADYYRSRREEAFEFLKNQYDGRDNGDKCIIIPLNNKSNIQITFKVDEEEEKEEEEEEDEEEEEEELTKEIERRYREETENKVQVPTEFKICYNGYNLRNRKSRNDVYKGKDAYDHDLYYPIERPDDIRKDRPLLCIEVVDN